MCPGSQSHCPPVPTHSRSIGGKKEATPSPSARLGRVIRQVQEQEVPSLVTPMWGSSLVPTSLGSNRGFAVHSSGTSRSFSGSSGSTSPACSSGTAAPLHVARLRSVHASAGFRGSVSQLLVTSWRPGTHRRYDSVSSVWRSWCLGLSVDPVCPFSETCQQFLLKHSRNTTIAGYWTALSSALPPRFATRKIVVLF